MNSHDAFPAQRFEIEPPGSGANAMLWLLCLALPLAVAGAVLGSVLAQADPAHPNLIGGSRAITIAFTIALVMAIALPLAVWLHRTMRQSAVELDRTLLTLRAGWYRQRIAVSDLELSRSRVLSLDEFPEYRPWLKSNAISLPGYHAGHFRLRNLRRKAFCILTSRQKVLMLQERSGRTILLSLRQPRALLDALKQAAGG